MCQLFFRFTAFLPPVNEIKGKIMISQRMSFSGSGGGGYLPLGSEGAYPPGHTHPWTPLPYGHTPPDTQPCTHTPRHTPWTHNSPVDTHPPGHTPLGHPHPGSSPPPTAHTPVTHSPGHIPLHTPWIHIPWTHNPPVGTHTPGLTHTHPPLTTHSSAPSRLSINSGFLFLKLFVCFERKVKYCCSITTPKFEQSLKWY